MFHFNRLQNTIKTLNPLSYEKAILPKDRSQ